MSELSAAGLLRWCDLTALALRNLGDTGPTADAEMLEHVRDALATAEARVADLETALREEGHGGENLGEWCPANDPPYKATECPGCAALSRKEATMPSEGGAR